MKKLLISLAIIASAFMANAQGFRMMGGGMQNNPIMLLARNDVQEDLALTDDQKDKLSSFSDQQAIRDKFMKAMQEAGISFEDMRSEEGRKKMQPIMEKMMADTTKEVEAILTPDQGKRLKEISIQFVGNRIVMTNKDVQKALEITDDQKAKFGELQKAQGEAMRALGEKLRNQEISMEEMREKSQKNDEIMNAEVGKVLTDAQRAKLVTMGGKKFVRKDDQI
jgi:hypothetical protein